VALLSSSDSWGGVPLVAVFDNPKTVVPRRKAATIEWNRAFGQNERRPGSIGFTATLYLYPERVRIVAGRLEAVHERDRQGKDRFLPGHRAAMLATVSGRRAKLYFKRQRLIEELSEASRAGRLREAMEPYIHTGVLVIDEIGYLTCPMDVANVLFQVVNQRHLAHRPIVITTNKPLAAWTDVLHGADLAEAIIDRVLERGRFIELRGSSYRTRHLNEKTRATKGGGAGPRGSRRDAELLPIPSSASEQRASVWTIEMFPRATGGPSTAWRSIEEADLHEVRLVDLFDRPCVFADRSGDGGQSDRTSVELVQHGCQDLPVELVQAVSIDLEPLQRRRGGLGGDPISAIDLDEVPDPAKQTVRHARCTARAPGQLDRAVLVETESEYVGGSHRDPNEIGNTVVIQVVDDPETVPERGREQTVARGGTHQSETRKLEPHGAGARTVPDDEVEHTVLHRGIEDLLQSSTEPVDLVDEQHLAFLEVGDDCRQVASLLDRRPRGNPHRCVHLVGDHMGECGLSQSRRTVEQDVIERLAPHLCGLDENVEVRLDPLLTEILGEPARAQCTLEHPFFRVRDTADDTLVFQEDSLSFASARQTGQRLLQ
jgi:hypothetical protein